MKEFKLYSGDEGKQGSHITSLHFSSIILQPCGNWLCVRQDGKPGVQLGAQYNDPDKKQQGCELTQ